MKKTINILKAMFIKTENWHHEATMKHMYIAGLIKPSVGFSIKDNSPVFNNGYSYSRKDYDPILLNVKLNYKTKEDATRYLDRFKEKYDKAVKAIEIKNREGFDKMLPEYKKMLADFYKSKEVKVK